MVALIALIVPWYYLSPYLATPVIAAAGELMQWLFHWVVGVERHGTVGTLLTSLNVLVPQGGRLVVAQLSPEVNYRSFGYGLALFYALMVASWPKRMGLKLALGTCDFCQARNSALSGCAAKNAATRSGSGLPVAGSGVEASTCS